MSHEKHSDIDKTLVTAKLSKLRQYQKYLKELKTSTFEDFKSDFKINGAAERYLQVSIECMIDLGNEIISSFNFKDRSVTATFHISWLNQG